MARKGSKRVYKPGRPRQKRDQHVSRMYASLEMLKLQLPLGLNSEKLTGYFFSISQRRVCRQMLYRLLGATHKLRLTAYAGMTRDRVTEMRQIFSPKALIGTDTRTRAADSRRRAAGVAELKASLNYINAYGLKMKQHEDGSYEQGVPETDTTDNDEDSQEEESKDDNGEGQDEKQKDVVEEQEDSEMLDITTRTQRLKLVVRPKKHDKTAVREIE